jgi:hypothetical protein
MQLLCTCDDEISQSYTCGLQVCIHRMHFIYMQVTCIQAIRWQLACKSVRRHDSEESGNTGATELRF